MRFLERDNNEFMGLWVYEFLSARSGDRIWGLMLRGRAKVDRLRGKHWDKSRC